MRRVLGEIVSDGKADVAYLRGSLTFDPVQAHPGTAGLACAYGAGRSGEWIATSGGDQRVRLWSASDGVLMAEFHTAAPCISLAVRGRHLVGGDLEGTVYILELEEDEEEVSTGKW